MHLEHLLNGSDIQGVALDFNSEEPVDFTEDAAWLLARAFGAWLRRKLHKRDLTVAVGRDSRLSGPKLAHAAMDGLLYDGADVFDTGLSSSPAMFMATVFDEFDCDGSIMFTAGRLPANRNGMRFFFKGGSLDAEDVQSLIEIAQKETFDHYSGGSVTKSDLMSVYAGHMRNLIIEKADLQDTPEPLKDLHVVVDASNGVGGFFVDQVLKPLGANVEGSLFLEPDGRFPNHLPDPDDAEAISFLINAVKASKADLGIVFDSDVDSSSAVDAQGNPIGSSEVLALGTILAEKHRPQADRKPAAKAPGKPDGPAKNKETGRTVSKPEGKTDETKAGSLSETGEETAFKDDYFLDDGAFLAAQIVIEAASHSISDLIRDLKPSFAEEEIQVPVTEKSYREYKKQVLEDLRNYAREQGYAILDAPEGEGVRIQFDDDPENGWIQVSLSFHKSLLSVNVESGSPHKARTAAKELFAFLKQYPSLDLSRVKSFLKS